MTYEQLDAIADAYIPVLAIILLGTLFVSLIKKRVKLSKRLGLASLLSISSVYALMAIDNMLAIWPSLGLDYSTHTALSLALVQMLSFANSSSHYARLGLWGSMLAYAILMVYQKYHTVADIISTALVLGPLVYWLGKRITAPG